MNRDEQKRRHDRIVSAIKRGRTVTSVAEQFNVTNDTVYKVLRVAHVKPRKICAA